MKELATLLSMFLIISCGTEKPKTIKKVAKDYSQFSENERDSIATDFNAWANYFIQSSFAYRVYKDSANSAQPKDLAFLQTKSYSYKKRGEHIEAMRILNEVVEKDVKTGSVDALQYRAWSLLYYYRDYDGALRDIIKIEQMTGDDYSQCWGEPCGFQKAQALYKLHQYEEAILAMQKIIDIEIDRYKEASNQMYYLYLGRCFQKLENHDQAKEAYLKSIAISSRFCEGYYFLGEIYEQLEKPKAAQLAYKNAKLFQRYKMEEPYVERFDEVFPYMIEKKLSRLTVD